MTYVPHDKQREDWKHKTKEYKAFSKRMAKFLLETTNILDKAIKDTREKYPKLFTKGGL